jgi:hypothetical protein
VEARGIRDYLKEVGIAGVRIGAGNGCMLAFVQIRNGLRKLEIGIEVGIVRTAPVARPPTGVQRELCEGNLGGALSGANLRLV